ncbi:hypothetical protein [Tessaracoccus massiliensis]|uniref:hypothetical protein n=1 Tax=Tessaracoccus massiliensis TaxID=1522311 RepID=UPI00058B1B2E|nr:hypothetical protein [Tessaracoccus massiliensis]
MTFDEPVTTRYIKLTSISAVTINNFASAAEIRVTGVSAAAPKELVDPPLGPYPGSTPEPTQTPDPTVEPTE